MQAVQVKTSLTMQVNDTASSAGKTNAIALQVNASQTMQVKGNASIAGKSY